MAKANYNALNIWQGRLGGQVYKKTRGKQIIGIFSKPRNPRTKGQAIVRAKFSLLNEIMHTFRAAIKLGYKGYANSQRSIPSACFFKKNYAIVTGTTPGALTINPTLLKLSYGGRVTGVYGNCSQVDTNIRVEITDGSSPYPEEETDLIYGVIYLPGLKQAVVSTGVARTATKVDIPIPHGWSGEVYVYAFAVAADGNGASDTQYIGTVNI